MNTDKIEARWRAQDAEDLRGGNQLIALCEGASQMHDDIRWLLDRVSALEVLKGHSDIDQCPRCDPSFPRTCPECHQYQHGRLDGAGTVDWYATVCSGCYKRDAAALDTTR